MANTTVACTNINLLKESQIPASPSQTELYAVELDGKPVTETQLNQKLDLDVGNATSTTKESIVSWGMPSGTTIDVAFLPSGSHYTAPQNGFYCIGLNMGSGWANVSTSGGFLLPFKAGDTYGSCIVPMKKGQEMWIDYYGVSKSTLLFVYTGG